MGEADLVLVGGDDEVRDRVPAGLVVIDPTAVQVVAEEALEARLSASLRDVGPQDLCTVPGDRVRPFCGGEVDRSQLDLEAGEESGRRRVVPRRVVAAVVFVEHLQQLSFRHPLQQEIGHLGVRAVGDLRAALGHEGP